MTPEAADPIEDLLAEALAAFDEGGESALQALLEAHPRERAALERGLARCRQMGMLGGGAPVRDFPERLGEFRLLRRIGSGGMGVVYEAEQQSLQRRVALKVVRPELLYFEGARERFRREIEAVAKLSHPAIVPVLASGEQDGLPWYAMELIDGKSAHDVCAELRPRDPATLTAEDLRQALGARPGTGTDPFAGAWWQACVRVVHQIALGVRHAHLRGIVHRDIKPGNVMLLPDGRTVLLDFGIAMVAGSQPHTRTGATPGSPAFMSPEQLRGDAVDERTDVYSLAATLWQLLTLVPPFAGVDDLQRIRNGDVPPVRARNRDVPPELALVIETAMDRDRERRYPTVEAFADDLLAVLQRRPIRARRLGLGLRVTRWCQRHRVAATALACAAGAALLAPIAFAWRERAVNAELSQAVRSQEESLETTLRAIRELLVRIADDRLRHVPAADRVAREALTEACAMYRQLLPKHPDHARLRGDAARAMTRLADLLGHHGDEEGAQRLLQEAIAACGGDDLAVAEELFLPRVVARIHFGSTAAMHGDRAVAAAAFDGAERDLAPLVGKDAWYRESLRTRIELAQQRASLLDPATDAEAIERGYLEAVTMARELHRRDVHNLHDCRQLVQRLDVLATFLGDLRRYADARPLLDEALALAEAIPTDAPFWPPQPLLVADVLETLGTQLVTQKDLGAVPLLKRCLELREAAAAAHPEDVEVRCDVGAALHNLAWMNYRQAQDERALERLERAIALQRSVLADMPTYTQGRDYLRNHLTLRGTVARHLGRPADLFASCRELTAMQDDRAAQRSVARLWLRLAQIAADGSTDGGADNGADAALPTARACEDQALACLLRAEQLGWGRGNRLDDALYQPLQERPEFRALQQRLADRKK